LTADGHPLPRWQSYGLVEDDYGNPACVADNVGDNVGNIAAGEQVSSSLLAEATCFALVLAAACPGLKDSWARPRYTLLIPLRALIWESSPCRCGACGGIYMEVADVDADLSGKNDYGLEEDDYGSPACVADNVDDNVGNIALRAGGRALRLFWRRPPASHWCWLRPDLTWRCGACGGVYTEIADADADLSGKNDYGLEEDDYGNPACVADNVDDHVGNIAGRSAGLFISFAEAACTALVLVATCPDLKDSWASPMYPLLTSSTGVALGDPHPAGAEPGAPSEGACQHGRGPEGHPGDQHSADDASYNLAVHVVPARGVQDGREVGAGEVVVQATAGYGLSGSAVALFGRVGGASTRRPQAWVRTFRARTTRVWFVELLELQCRHLLSYCRVEL
jgi:Na+/H+-translocating membrane pyrophosphatase